MEKEWVVVDDESGVSLLTIVADAAMGGVSITAHGVWHNPALIDRYVGVFAEARNWLINNGVNP